MIRLPQSKSLKVVVSVLLGVVLLLSTAVALGADYKDRSGSAVAGLDDSAVGLPDEGLIDRQPLQQSRQSTSDAFPLSTFNPVIFGDQDLVQSVAWGDADGDGDLDLAVGSDNPSGNTVLLYLNEKGSFSRTDVFKDAGTVQASSVAWGDANGDGWLDLAVGNYGSANQLFINDQMGGFSLTTQSWISDTKNTHSVAWGDANGDGWLDLAVGNDEDANDLYINDQAGGFALTSQAWVNDVNDTDSVAWGDVNGDGWLDLAVGNDGSANQLYINDQAGGFALTALAWVSETKSTKSVAWGDVDGDGDLDLAVGNEFDENDIYLNNNGAFTLGQNWGTASGQTLSVAWGDVNGDGRLDLVAGNNFEANRIYLNDSGSITSTISWTSGDANDSLAVAWGDMDGDGDLDLVAGNQLDPAKIYRNLNGIMETAASWVDKNSSISIQSVAWGDANGDGWPDFAVGTTIGENQLYINDQMGGFTLTTKAWINDTDATNAIAWGDANGDGWLDLAVGNGDAPNQLYINDGAGGFALTDKDWVSDLMLTSSIAWGDVNGDGWADLAVGNYAQPNQIYLNDGTGGFTLVDASVLPMGESTEALAWGDVDGDGDLDLAVVNQGEANRVHLNVSGMLTSTNDWVSPDRDWSTSVAWGDLDGDGDLDLAVGNDFSSDKVYINDRGVLTTTNGWVSGDGGGTKHIAWGDADGDGDLDLAVAKDSDPLAGIEAKNRVYLNEGGVLQTAADGYWVAADEYSTFGIAWGDADQDGDLDLLTGNKNGATTLHINGTQWTSGLPKTSPYLTVDRPITAPVADLYVPSILITDTEITIPFTLFGADGDVVAQVQGEYSFNGGGEWLPAVPTSGTQTDQLAVSAWPTGTAHTFTWDTFASGFFGRSDNVVFRLTALSVPTGTNSYVYTNAVPSPIQRPFASAATYPFQVQGTQVRVISGTQPVEGAIVYQLEDGKTIGGNLIGLDGGEPYETAADGLLEGSGSVGLNNTLFALAPMASFDKYEVFATNIQLTADTITGHVVTEAGEQAITVSADNPLILFDLDISLEWDARQDNSYMTELTTNLQRSSELLFDWTNGRVALGHITIYHDKENWETADIQILANNRYRPNARRGGVSATTVTDIVTRPDSPFTRTLTFEPGQVRMGVIWNRSGDSFENQGEDWSRVLVHEFGHYLFFMADNYFGFDENGQFTLIDTCTGIMADPYAQNEFHAVNDRWLTDCQYSASNVGTALSTVVTDTNGVTSTQEIGRSDWETLVHFYPWLDAPTADIDGPFVLPLNVTEIEFVSPEDDSETLALPYFTMIDAGKGVFQDSAGAGGAFLVKNDGRLIKLGTPDYSQIFARGVEPGDQLCYQNTGERYFGCKQITSNDNLELDVSSAAGWEPDIIIQPVTSTTLKITFTTNIEQQTVVTVYDEAGAPEASFGLNQARSVMRNGESVFVYTGEVTFDKIALAATVVVQQDALTLISDYAMGGDATCRRGQDCSPCRRGQDCSPCKRGQDCAPVFSTDGRAAIIGEEPLIDQGEIYILQAANRVPVTPPGWGVPVGQPYRLAATEQMTSFTNLTIQISYLNRDVPDGAQDELFVYYYSAGTGWVKLPTQRTESPSTLVTAPLQGEGIYLVLATIETPSLFTGWNLFAYPNVTARPITEALSSLDPDLYDCQLFNGTQEKHCYTSILQYDDSEWLLYDATVPEPYADMVNTLSTLEPLNSYWIYALQQVNPLINPRTAERSLTDVPPATFYGEVTPSGTFDPVEGEMVLAYVGDRLCGVGQIVDLSGSLGYTIQVEADQTGSNCGGDGQAVTFVVSGESADLYSSLADLDGENQVMPYTGVWRNEAACYHPLAVDGEAPAVCFVASPAVSIFLPWVVR